METINYTYHFDFEDHESQTCVIKLDPKTLSQIDRIKESPSQWTKLNFHICKNCTLDELETTYCPLALSLEPFLDKIKNITSFDKTKVTVKMNERTISNEISAQEGFSSLFGVITATSDCPHTKFFKPMARFHLPFANEEETFFRAASTYMLAQYYRHKDGKSVDMDMKGLFELYEKVAEVNKGISNRIRAESRADSAVNAVIILDMFVKSITFTLEDTLEDLSPLFHQFTDSY